MSWSIMNLSCLNQILSSRHDPKNLLPPNPNCLITDHSHFQPCIIGPHYFCLQMLYELRKKQFETNQMSPRSCLQHYVLKIQVWSGVGGREGVCMCVWCLWWCMGDTINLLCKHLKIQTRMVISVTTDASSKFEQA